jgi:hypothetical protein
MPLLMVMYQGLMEFFSKPLDHGREAGKPGSQVARGPDSQGAAPSEGSRLMYLRQRMRLDSRLIKDEREAFGNPSLRLRQALPLVAARQPPPLLATCQPPPLLATCQPPPLLAAPSGPTPSCGSSASTPCLRLREAPPPACAVGPNTASQRPYPWPKPTAAPPRSEDLFVSAVRTFCVSVDTDVLPPCCSPPTRCPIP